MDGLRRLVDWVRQDRSRIVAAVVVLVIVVGAAGYGAYQAFGPTLRGVLPLPPTEFVQGEFLVKFQPGAAAEARRSLNAQNNVTELEEIPGIAVSRLKVPTGRGVNEMVNLYGRNPNVVYAEPNYIRQATDGPFNGTPSDPYIGNQWDMTKINAAGAWAVTTGSSAVKIAILDTGIDTGHANFTGKLVGAPALDDNGHGTQVAGYAGANGNDGIGTAGVCWACPILSIKVLAASGAGGDSTIATGIVTAADAGARVINLSLGGYVISNTMQDAVNYAWNKGVVIIGAAGNDSTTTPFYPAAFPHVLAVGSSTTTDGRMSTSNYGPWVHVFAPGVSVPTTKLGNAYTSVSGTSMAAPHVAGLAALIISANPGLTNQQVFDLIVNNADTVAAGKRINAQTAVAAAAGTPVAASTTATPAPTASPTPAATTSAPTASPTPAPTTAAPTASPTPAPTTPAPTASPTPAPTPSPTPAPTASPTPVPTAATVTDTFTGGVGGRNQPTSQDFNITVAAGGTISASLGGWSGNPSNNKLTLTILSGSTVLASDTSTNRPKNLSIDVSSSGTYTLRVTAASGSGNFTLTVTHP